MITGQPPRHVDPATLDPCEQCVLGDADARSKVDCQPFVFFEHKDSVDVIAGPPDFPHVTQDVADEIAVKSLRLFGRAGTHHG